MSSEEGHYSDGPESEVPDESEIPEDSEVLDDSGLPGNSEAKWLEQYLHYDKQYLLSEVDPLTLNQIRETMGDQEFIDHWKLSEQEYQYVLDGQSTLDDMEDYGNQLPEEVIEEDPTAEQVTEEEEYINTDGDDIELEEYSENIPQHTIIVHDHMSVDDIPSPPPAPLQINSMNEKKKDNINLQREYKEDEIEEIEVEDFDANQQIYVQTETFQPQEPAEPQQAEMQALEGEAVGYETEEEQEAQEAAKMPVYRKVFPCDGGEPYIVGGEDYFERKREIQVKNNEIFRAHGLYDQVVQPERVPVQPIQPVQPVQPQPHMTRSGMYQTPTGRRNLETSELQKFVERSSTREQPKKGGVIQNPDGSTLHRADDEIVLPDGRVAKRMVNNGRGVYASGLRKSHYMNQSGHAVTNTPFAQRVTGRLTADPETNPMKYSTYSRHKTPNVRASHHIQASARNVPTSLRKSGARQVLHKVNTSAQSIRQSGHNTLRRSGLQAAQPSQIYRSPAKPLQTSQYINTPQKSLHTSQYINTPQQSTYIANGASAHTKSSHVFPTNYHLSTNQVLSKNRLTSPRVATTQKSLYSQNNQSLRQIGHNANYLQYQGQPGRVVASGAGLSRYNASGLHGSRYAGSAYSRGNFTREARPNGGKTIIASKVGGEVRQARSNLRGSMRKIGGSYASASNGLVARGGTGIRLAGRSQYVR
jgi:hypothetical protein